MQDQADDAADDGEIAEQGHGAFLGGRFGRDGFVLHDGGLVPPARSGFTGTLQGVAVTLERGLTNGSRKVQSSGNDAQAAAAASAFFFFLSQYQAMMMQLS